MSHANKALQLLQAQLDAGRSRSWIASQIGYSRPALSLYLLGRYPADAKAIEAAVIKRFEIRICPHDQQEKLPQQCQRIALRPRPQGFPDAEYLWLACQTCPHKPEGDKA